MIFTLLFIVGSISERLFNIEIGPIRLGPGDLVILLSLPYAVIVLGKIRTIFLKLAVLAFIVIFISIFMNSYSYGYNTLITVPLRIIVAGIIAHELLTLTRPALWVIICSITYIISLILAMFFSDGSPIQIIELFNRNELLGYSVVLVLLALFASYKRNDLLKRPIGFREISLVIFLIFVATIMQSRQNILSLMIGLFILFTFLPPRTKLLALSFSFACALLIGPFIVKTVVLNERLSARLSTVTEFEPATRADKYRLSNIIQAIDGFNRSPVYGNGPTSFIRNNEHNKVAHSTPFSVLYELGALGLILLFTIFYFIIRLPLTLKKYDTLQPSLAIIASLMPVIVIQSFFIELLPKAPLYVYLAISIATLVCARKQLRYTEYAR